MITASKDILYSVLKGEWKGLSIRVVQISNNMDPFIKFFKLEEFAFDSVEACENCQAPPSACENCDGTVEILALVGSLNVNGHSVEDGIVVPMLGDVLFDLREGHLAILTDSDATIITSVINAFDKDDSGYNLALEASELVKGKEMELKSRFYLVNEMKIKRLAATALFDGRKFNELAGKKAVIVDAAYIMQDKKPLYLRSIRIFYAYFDMEGTIIKHLTFPTSKMEFKGDINFSPKILKELEKDELAKKDSPEQDDPNDLDQEDNLENEKVVKIGQRNVQPVLLSEEKEIIKNRLIKDLGIEVWEKTSSRVKEKLE